MEEEEEEICYRVPREIFSPERPEYRFLKSFPCKDARNYDPYIGANENKVNCLSFKGFLINFLCLFASIFIKLFLVFINFQF